MSGSIDYSALQTAVNKLIAQAGEPVTLRKRADTTSPTSQPWRPGAPSYTDYPSHAVFFPNGIRGPFRLALRKESDVAGSDLVCYLPGSALPEPSRVDLTDQLVRADGTVWAIRFADFLDPAGKVLYYELRLMK